jgi:amino acid transporter
MYFACSRDSLLPKWFNVVNTRFSSPVRTGTLLLFPISSTSELCLGRHATHRFLLFPIRLCQQLMTSLSSLARCRSRIHPYSTCSRFRRRLRRRDRHRYFRSLHLLRPPSRLPTTRERTIRQYSRSFLPREV